MRIAPIIALRRMRMSPADARAILSSGRPLYERPEDWMTRNIWIKEHSLDTNQALYTVMSAIRGCDNMDWFPKSELTARLRSIVFTEHECRGQYNKRVIEPIKLPKLRGDKEWVNRVPPTLYAEHALRHMKEAILFTWGHAVWGGHEITVYRWIEDALLFIDDNERAFLVAQRDRVAVEIAVRNGLYIYNAKEVKS